MYILRIPRNKTNIINILDTLRSKPIDSVIHVSDVKTARILGMYTKPWHHNGFLGIYQDPVLRDTIVKFNVGNVERRIGLGKRVEYVIDDRFLSTKIKIPKI
jgi:hypothetical protein